MELQFLDSSCFWQHEKEWPCPCCHSNEREPVSWPFEIQGKQGGHQITAHHQSKSKLLGKFVPEEYARKNTRALCWSLKWKQASILLVVYQWNWSWNHAQVKPCDPMVEWNVCTDPEGSPSASNLNTTGMRFRGDFSPQSFSDNLTGCVGFEIINLTMYIYIFQSNSINGSHGLILMMDHNLLGFLGSINDCGFCFDTC